MQRSHIMASKAKHSSISSKYILKKTGKFSLYEHHRGSNGHILSQKDPKYNHFVNNSSIWTFWLYKTATETHKKWSMVKLLKKSYKTVDGIHVYATLGGQMPLFLPKNDLKYRCFANNSQIYTVKWYKGAL